MDNTDISTSGKGKTPVSTNDIEAYNKETLGDEIRRLITANAQLIINKMKTEKIKINLEVDKVQLFDKKNSLVVKRKKLRAKIVILNVAGSSNVSIRKHQNILLRSTQNKFKVKRPPLFDNLKENF